MGNAPTRVYRYYLEIETIPNAIAISKIEKEALSLL
jgi:hypothetical protein